MRVHNRRSAVPEGGDGGGEQQGGVSSVQTQQQLLVGLQDVVASAAGHLSGAVGLVSSSQPDQVLTEVNPLVTEHLLGRQQIIITGSSDGGIIVSRTADRITSTPAEVLESKPGKHVLVAERIADSQLNDEVFEHQ